MTGIENGSPSIYPVLSYQDAPAAIAWLTTAFGFEPLMVVPNDAGGVMHAELRFGNGLVMLGSGRSAWAQGLYLVVADADAHYDRALAAGAEITRPLHDTDYGAREYTAKDPEGNEWSFGTYLPALTVSTEYPPPVAAGST